jgi:tRNA dimethylallyltransferase
VSEGPAALVLTGPTTSGKTDLSLEVAHRLRGEIISMDSRQVYRGMDIGTDKVLPMDRAGVPHFGLDLVDPDERYSAGRFARDARRWVEEIRARGHVPILTGGTGFFLRAVLQPMFQEPELDPVRLRRLRAWLKTRDRETLERWVRRLDPERAELAREGGPQRLSRSVEIPLLTGRPLSWWHRSAPEEAPGMACCVVLLELPREELDRRIDARVGRMVERGFLDEVRGLLERGYGPGDPGMTGTGYREVAAHLRGEMDLGDALERMRLQTRQYARRQLTWFRNQLADDVVRVDARLSLRDKARRIEDAWSAAQTRETG